MREFLFKERHGKQKNFSVMVDIIDENSENMTIMDFRGDENSSFFTFFPWNKGEVLTKTDLIAWFESVNGRYKGYEYNNNGDQYETELCADAEGYTLSITPYMEKGMSGSDSVEIKVLCYNTDGVLLDSFILRVENEVTKSIPVISGNVYGFEVIDAYWQGAAPDPIFINGADANVDLYISNIPPEAKDWFYVQNVGGEKAGKRNPNTFFLKQVSNALEYSFDALHWQKYSSPIEFKNKLYLRSSLTYYSQDSSFNCANPYNVGGNIMSLMYGDKFTGKETEFPNENCRFYWLFRGSPVVSAANLKMPATKLCPSCYQSMFSDCNLLSDIPDFIRYVETLAQGCFSEMFQGCSSLTQAPTLAFTKLAPYCYYGMFMGCSKITQAPELPATELTSGCYSFMFNGCTSLTQAPVLPATKLAEQCYQSMFAYSSIITAPELPVMNLQEECYATMFQGCSKITKAPALPAKILAEKCYNAMFNNCTNLEEAPELPATQLVKECYRAMFSGCGKINSVRVHIAGQWDSAETQMWLRGVAQSGILYNLGEATDIPTSSENGCPSGWEIQTEKEYDYTITEMFLPNVTQMDNQHSLTYAGDDVLAAFVDDEADSTYNLYDANDQSIGKGTFKYNANIDFSTFQPGEYRVQLMESKGSEANYKVVKKSKSDK